MSSQVFYDEMSGTPIGRLWLAAGPAGLVAIHMHTDETGFLAEVERLTGAAPERDPVHLAAATHQLRQYLAGERREFDLLLDWSVMTDFQQTVLRRVYAIPYGQLSTYGDIARELARPGAARAVGRANATNPIPIVVPCHRVLGSNGALHGYGGGLERKAWLLRLEGSWLL